MSEVIDWSKAPEGATHAWKSKHSDLICWYKTDCNPFQYCYSDGACIFSDGIGEPSHDPRIARPVSVMTAWSGEGLPPVGLTVRIPDDMACGNEFLEQFEGLTVEIVGHTKNDINTPLATFRYKADGSYRYHALCGDNGNFEPIRTAEQIAADERDNRAHDLFRIAWPETHSWSDLSPHWQEAFYRLADSSYRKP